MTLVRRPDLAGSWYPPHKPGCVREMERFMAQIPKVSSEKIKGLGGIVPHAGWYFSGHIACAVFAALAKVAKPEVVAVIGMHLAPGSPNYIMRDGEWETPLGNLVINKGLAEELLANFTFQVETGSRHTPDNTIELQLPFVKYFFPSAELLPIGLPPRKESLGISRHLARKAREKSIPLLIVGSSDLTHYGPNYGFSPRGFGEEAVDWVRKENDKRLIDRIVRMDPEGVMEEALLNHNACCCGAVASAVAAAKELGADKGELILYATSFEKMPGDSFVGYAGVAF